MAASPSPRDVHQARTCGAETTQAFRRRLRRQRQLCNTATYTPAFLLMARPQVFIKSQYVVLERKAVLQNAASQEAVACVSLDVVPQAAEQQGREAGEVFELGGMELHRYVHGELGPGSVAAVASVLLDVVPPADVACGDAPVVPRGVALPQHQGREAGEVFELGGMKPHRFVHGERGPGSGAVCVTPATALAAKTSNALSDVYGSGTSDGIREVVGLASPTYPVDMGSYVSNLSLRSVRREAFSQMVAASRRLRARSLLQDISFGRGRDLKPCDEASTCASSSDLKPATSAMAFRPIAFDSDLYAEAEEVIADRLNELGETGEEFTVTGMVEWYLRHSGCSAGAQCRRCRDMALRIVCSLLGDDVARYT